MTRQDPAYETDDTQSSRDFAKGWNRFVPKSLSLPVLPALPSMKEVFAARVVTVIDESYREGNEAVQQVITNRRDCILNLEGRGVLIFSMTYRPSKQQFVSYGPYLPGARAPVLWLSLDGTQRSVCHEKFNRQEVLRYFGDDAPRRFDCTLSCRGDHYCNDDRNRTPSWSEIPGGKPVGEGVCSYSPYDLIRSLPSARKEITQRIAKHVDEGSNKALIPPLAHLVAEYAFASVEWIEGP